MGTHPIFESDFDCLTDIMSQMYMMEPPTNGKVVLRTSSGDIDVELWPKEAPLACRNFVQLCMENYYDATIFHRVVPGFIIQGGDPTGTGMGGDSIYGKPFKDEFHSRLRFTHRDSSLWQMVEKMITGHNFSSPWDRQMILIRNTQFSERSQEIQSTTWSNWLKARPTIKKDLSIPIISKLRTF